MILNKGCRKMEGATCDVTVSRGPLGLCRSLLEKEGKGTLLVEGNEEDCGPRALELDCRRH